MHTDKNRTRIALIILVTFLTCCTSSEVCENITTVPLRIGFFSENPDDPDQPESYLLDSITAFGITKDSLIYDNQKNVSLIELPIDPSANSSGFIFLISPADSTDVPAQDTLWINYEKQPTLISMECGFVNFFEIESVSYSSQQIDTIIIENSSVNNSFDVHLQVFPIPFFGSSNSSLP